MAAEACPAAKRRKPILLQNSEGAGNRRMRPVLADEYYGPVETDLFIVGTLADRRMAAGTLKQLQALMPLPNHSHLKRIRSTATRSERQFQILICPLGEHGNVESVLQTLATEGLDSRTFTSTSELSVPARAPLTRQQFEEAAMLWPVSFHEHKHMAKVLSGRIFNSKELEQINHFMREAISAAQKARSEGRTPVGCIVVDRHSNTILSVASDHSWCCHPLQHAVMVGLDQIARTQGGGAWREAPRCGQGALETSQHLVVEGATTTCSQPTPSTSLSSEHLPYLCTDCDLYVTREPCVMCSMALVHSRISRVFYGVSFAGHGGLGSMFKVHCQRGINHHFEVYCGVLETECALLLES